jgi:sec-independent protein translocase protein TatA
LLVFGGKGKISDIMGDVAKGIKSFKKGLAEEDQKPEVVAPGDRRCAPLIIKPPPTRQIQTPQAGLIAPADRVAFREPGRAGANQG